MTSDRLRREFLNFFKKKNHEIIPSDSLIPRHDPTLLFTGAGMNQFKEQFLGKNITFTRAATCQKCLRTADLEKVGKTAGHHTFFEMLGNFSFGDYSKKEAIGWAWEFLTDSVKLPKEKLWASIYEEDGEAFDIWKDLIGLPEYRIIKLGDKENFWPSEVKLNGPDGPCGPCSEIFYDWGADTGCRKSTCLPSCECGRFVEVWNLVFTQFNRIEGGLLKELPRKNIDTGMGLERLAAVKQGVRTNFQIDSFKPLIRSVAGQLDYKYGLNHQNDSHINAIADHVRAITFAIADGVRPSNEGRGFVIRKLIRKSAQRARSIGFEEPFIYKEVALVAKIVKGPYPELARLREDIAQVVLKEEESLKDILETVLPNMESEFQELEKKGDSTILGALIFKYYDEKGIPLDLIEEKALFHNLSLDMDGFKRLLDEQKKRSRAASKVTGSIFFEKLFSDKETEGDKVKVKIDWKRRLLIAKNHTATHLLHAALKKILGRHVSQFGSLVAPDRLRFDFTHPSKLDPHEIERIERLVNEFIRNRYKVESRRMGLQAAKKEGAIALFGEKYGDEVTVRSIGNISKELCGGTHVKNTGDIRVFKIISESSVASGVRRIEALTDEAVYNWMKQDIAKYLALYKDSLKKIKSLGDKESSVRLEKIEEYLEEKLIRVDGLIEKNTSSITKADLDLWIETLKPELMRAISDLDKESKAIQKRQKRLKQLDYKSKVDQIVKESRLIQNVKVISKEIQGADIDDLRGLLDSIKQKADSAVIVLAASKEKRVNIVLGVTKDLVSKGLDAGRLIKEIAGVVGGSGGGRPDLAQAGGKAPQKLEEALKLVYDVIRREVSK